MMRRRILTRINTICMALVVAFAQLTVLPVPRVAAESTDRGTLQPVWCQQTGHKWTAQIGGDNSNRSPLSLLPGIPGSQIINGQVYAPNSSSPALKGALDQACKDQYGGNVTPLAPQITVVCGANNNVITLPSTARITYAASGWSGGTATVTATADTNYTLTASNGYSVSGNVGTLMLSDDPLAGCPHVTPTAPTFNDTPCGVTGDTFTIPATNGVNYYVNGALTAAGTYPATGTVTITAASVDGYVLDDYPANGWSHTFTGDCESDVPEAPAVIDPCGLDNATWAKTLSDTDKYTVHYSDDGRSITLHARAGYTFANGSSTYEYGNAPDDGLRCATTTAPTIIDQCQRDQDRVIAKDTKTTDYSVVFDESTGEYTVTATAKTGYKFAPEQQTEWTGTLTNAPCPVTVVAAPQVVVDPCGTANDTYALTPYTGVRYLVNGEEVTATGQPLSTNGETDLEITAEALPGYTLTGTSTWALHFTDTACASNDGNWSADCDTITVNATNYPTGYYFTVTLYGANGQVLDTSGHIMTSESPWSMNVNSNIVRSFSYQIYDNLGTAIGKAQKRYATCPIETEEIAIPKAPKVTDPCGPNNATWKVPRDTDKLDWTLHEDGALTVATKDGYVFDDGTTSHNYGVAKDSNAPCVTHRVTLCHATGSTTNPYVRITVSAAGAYNGHLGDSHQDGRDIIPPFVWRDGETYSQNWNTEGQAIYDNDCKPVEIPEETAPDVTISAVCDMLGQTLAVTMTNSGDGDARVVMRGVTYMVSAGKSATVTLPLLNLVMPFSAQVYDNEGNLVDTLSVNAICQPGMGSEKPTPPTPTLRAAVGVTSATPTVAQTPAMLPQTGPEFTQPLLVVLAGMVTYLAVYLLGSARRQTETI